MTTAEQIAMEEYPDLFIRDDKMKTSGTALISDAAQMLRREGCVRGYTRGQQDRWIPVSEERQPKRNTMAIYWTPGLDGTVESGYPAIADEWRWEHHGKYATHYWDFSPPNPEQR